MDVRDADTCLSRSRCRPASVYRCRNLMYRTLLALRDLQSGLTHCSATVDGSHIPLAGVLTSQGFAAWARASGLFVTWILLANNGECGRALRHVRPKRPMTDPQRRGYPVDTGDVEIDAFLVAKDDRRRRERRTNGPRLKGSHSHVLDTRSFLTRNECCVSINWHLDDRRTS